MVLRALPLLGYHRVVFFEASLTPPPPTFRPSTPLEFAFVGPEALADLAAFRPRVDKGEFERRFDMHERCFVARTGGTIVCAYWAHRRTVRLRNVGCELIVDDDAVYVFDAFTSPEMRGKRIGSVVWRELNKRLASEGYDRSLSYVLGGNEAGLINARRAGSRETHRVAALKLGPLPPVRLPYRARNSNANADQSRLSERQ